MWRYRTYIHWNTHFLNNSYTSKRRCVSVWDFLWNLTFVFHQILLWHNLRTLISIKNFKEIPRILNINFLFYVAVTVCNEMIQYKDIRKFNRLNISLASSCTVIKNLFEIHFTLSFFVGKYWASLRNSILPLEGSH